MEAKEKEDSLKRFSVALVYIKDTFIGTEHHQTVDLRLLITSANSDAEALGKAILYFEKEVESGSRVSNKTVVQHVS